MAPPVPYRPMPPTGGYVPAVVACGVSPCGPGTPRAQRILLGSFGRSAPLTVCLCCSALFSDLRAGASTGSHRICRCHQPLSPTRPRVGPVPTAAGRASSERPCGPPRGQLQLALRARRCLQRGWVFASPEETRGRERPKGSAKPLVMTPFGGHPRAALRSRLSCTAPHPLLLTALVAGKGAPAEQFSHLLGW